MSTAALPTVPASSARSLRLSIGWQRHKRAGLMAALFLLLIGIPMALLTVKSSYTAEAVFQVAPAYQKTM